MKLLIAVFFPALLITSCTGRERPGTEAGRQLQTIADSVATPMPDTLQFVVEDKPCYAVIDRRYLNFSHRAEFPMSVFITLETRTRDRNGHPDAPESEEHLRLQSVITDSLDAVGVNAYIGKTTMTGFEDLIFYIKEKDLAGVRDRLKKLQSEHGRITAYTFERDPEWEAVSEFYEALEKGRIPRP